MSIEQLGAVADVHVASAAADAVHATPGVERLQPGLWGLVQQLSHELWEHTTGEPYPDVAGVEVELEDGVARVDVTLATDGTIPAAAVAVAVQRAVADAVAARTAVPVVSAAVHGEIALPDRDLPDWDLPGWDLPDWDLPGWDLPG